MPAEKLMAQAQQVAVQAREAAEKAQHLAAQAADKAGDYVKGLDAARDLIVQNFGQPGLIAAYLVLGALAVFVASRLAKLAFSTVKYLVLPAIALAFVGSLVSTWSFFTLLPVTVTACSLVLIVKG